MINLKSGDVLIDRSTKTKCVVVYVDAIGIVVKNTKNDVKTFYANNVIKHIDEIYEMEEGD